MSRAERRAYKRMTKNQDPYALPAGAAGRGRPAKKRSSRPSGPGGPFTFVTGRFLMWTLGGALAAGLLGFSLAWPSMPMAVYAGMGAAVGWGLLAVAVRIAQRRMAGLRR
jgi:hypothetical protein